MKHSIYNIFVLFAITFSVILIPVIVTFSYLSNSTTTRQTLSQLCNAMLKTGSVHVHVCMHAYIHVCKACVVAGWGGECETELERQACGQTEKQIDMMTET